MLENSCIMQIWAEPGKAALPICNYSQILYQFLTFTQNLKWSRREQKFPLEVASPAEILYIFVALPSCRGSHYSHSMRHYVLEVVRYLSGYSSAVPIS